MISIVILSETKNLCPIKIKPTEILHCVQDDRPPPVSFKKMCSREAASERIDFKF